MVYLEACRVFVVLHFRMYVAKLMCVRYRDGPKVHAAIYSERLNRMAYIG